jgi:hypothetical protein
MQHQPKKLLDQVRHIIRPEHYSMSTKEAYVSWIRRFILFHDKQHPRGMGVAGLAASRLAADRTGEPAFDRPTPFLVTCGIIPPL